MKSALANKVCVMLLGHSYTVKTLSGNCFDIIARKEGNILLIKILEDANSVSEDYTKEMKRISSYISTSPIIIAEKAGSGLIDNVVYKRFGIFTFNFNTFNNCIQNKLPFVLSDHAGMAASINADILMKKIEEDGVSISGLARKLGVSTKMIKNYGAGTKITINKAFKLYDMFGHSVFNKINVFSLDDVREKDSSTDVTRKYSDLGFEAIKTRKVPCDVIAKKNKDIILTGIGDKMNPEAKSLSKLIDANNLMIFRKKKPKDMPSMTIKEFLEFEEAAELIKFLKEY